MKFNNKRQMFFSFFSAFFLLSLCHRAYPFSVVRFSFLPFPLNISLVLLHCNRIFFSLHEFSFPSNKSQFHFISGKKSSRLMQVTTNWSEWFEMTFSRVGKNYINFIYRCHAFSTFDVFKEHVKMWAIKTSREKIISYFRSKLFMREN